MTTEPQQIVMWALSRVYLPNHKVLRHRGFVTPDCVAQCLPFAGVALFHTPTEARVGQVNYLLRPPYYKRETTLRIEKVTVTIEAARGE